MLAPGRSLSQVPERFPKRLQQALSYLEHNEFPGFGLAPPGASQTETTESPREILMLLWHWAKVLLGDGAAGLVF